MIAPAAYERTPYERVLATEIVSAGEDARGDFAILADTILFPEGGGQPADRGSINGVAVHDVQWIEGEARHYAAAPLAPGRAEVHLDWERRFDHMQQHTGQHLLTAVAQDRFGWATTAFHLGARVSDIELATAPPGSERLADLEDAVAAEIRAARPVTARRVTPGEFAALSVRTRGLPEDLAGGVRLVEIAGLDLNTCGGVHVRSTAEIEALKLLGVEPMRGGARLHFVAGGRVRRRCGEHERRNAELRRLLGAADEDLPEVARVKLDQLKDAEKRVRALEQRLAEREAEALAGGREDVLAAHWDEADAGFLRQVARELDRLGAPAVVLLTGGAGPTGVFLLRVGRGGPDDIAALGRGLAERLGGRGGGSGSMFQGKAPGLSRRDQALAWLRGQVRR